ncbi:MAG: T9SS type A sorting domain-containing protein [Bacteroidia bacterium]|nr:T9SS type A sorting domain-containing protein [Bacteroidia bacterium]
MKKTGLLICLLFIAIASNAQTLTSIRNIFQNKCISCHSPGNLSGGLDLSGNNSSIVSNLVGVVAQNSVASAQGKKLIDPGYPERSYLLRLLNSGGWESYTEYNLEAGENPGSHENLVTLEKEELELIRQWTLFNCNQTATVVNEQLLYNYYHVNGLPRISQPAAPAAGEGFQLKFGPIFLEPGKEIEYYLKHDLTIDESMEIKKIDCKINDYSHHFLLFKYEPGQQNSMPNGLREVNVSNVFPDQTTYLVTFTRSDSLNLPEGTAYRWPNNTVLDLNYHIINYNQDSIFAAEAYVNVYTQTVGTAEREMFSRIVVPTNNLAARYLIIPYGPDTVTFAEPDYTSYQDTVNIWMLTSHTHSRGTDFDIFKRTASGEKGEKLYEGFYNETYEFYEGYYDWSHPPIRYFDPLVPVKSHEGIIFEGKFCNYGPFGISPVVNFGLTTTDEMFIYFVQYTRGGYLWNNVGMDQASVPHPRIYPNPGSKWMLIESELPTINGFVECRNMVGQSFYLKPTELKQGRTQIDVSGLTPGIYLIKDSQGSVQKFIKGQ